MAASILVIEGVGYHRQRAVAAEKVVVKKISGAAVLGGEQIMAAGEVAVEEKGSKGWQSAY